MTVLYPVDADLHWLEDRASSPRDTFTDTVDRGWKLPLVDLCFLAPYGEAVTHVGLVNRGDMVATLKRRVRFTDVLSLEPPITFDELKSHVAPNLYPHIESRRQSGGPLPQKTSEAFVGAAKTLRPDAAHAIERLEGIARAPTRILQGRAAETLALERDALGVALMAAGIDRHEILAWRETPEPASFLSGLPRRTAIEDRFIDYDASVFGDWTLVDRDATGIAVFAEGRNHLTVINVNRTDVEHALGVDLVYYSHRFQSFVLVQYKRMSDEAGRSVYRPDKSLAAELERMRGLPVARGAPEDVSDYRLHPGSCYLKLCPPTPFRPRGHDLIKGMYLPLDYWDELIELGAVLGPKRGIAVTFENAERHLTSSLFAVLLREGWIGSTGESTRVLERVVDELLESGHSVTLAEYRRTHTPVS